MAQPDDDAMSGPDTGTIEIKVEKTGQLFDTLDPLPFRERDLDREAEDYILDWARELPHKAPIRIIVHLPAAEAQTEQARMLGQSIKRYFHYRAEAALRERRELFRTGRFSLLIGVSMLTACIAGGRFLAATVTVGHLGEILNEGLIILGWVANWRPIEIFLHDWWPILWRRRLYQRLAAAEITVAAR